MVICLTKKLEQRIKPRVPLEEVKCDHRFVRHVSSSSQPFQASLSEEVCAVFSTLLGYAVFERGWFRAR